MATFPGIGLGLNVPTAAVCLNSWFQEKKVMASGIIFTGAALGSFVYPVFLEWVFDIFGFRGGLLIFGGIMMHAIAAGMFIRMPPWLSAECVWFSNYESIELCSLGNDTHRDLVFRSGTSKQVSRRPSGVEAVETIPHPPQEPVLKRKTVMVRSVSQSSFESQDSREDLDDQKFHRFHEAVHHVTVETLPEVDEERDAAGNDHADEECCKNGKLITSGCCNPPPSMS